MNALSRLFLMLVMLTFVGQPAFSQQAADSPGSPGDTTTIDGRYIPAPPQNSGAMAAPPDSGIIQPIYEEHTAPAPAKPGIPPPPDAQARVNNVVAQSLGSINECYRGVHTTFNNDIVGWALQKLFKKAAEPGGLCDQYQKHAADIPLEVSVPLLPGVSVNTEKLCKLLQHPSCDK